MTRIQAGVVPEIIEIEHHIHNRNRVIGENVSRNGELVCGAADLMAPFQITSGSDTWGGTPLCLIGTDDGPFITGMTMYDAHEIIVTDVTAGADTDVHLVQLIYGTGTVANAVSAEQYSTHILTPQRTVSVAESEVLMPRLTYGTDKLWARHWVDGESAMTMDFFIILHEYAV